MLENIICTCGKNIGSLIDVYDYCSNRIKEEYIKSQLPDTAIDRIQWNSKWNIEMGSLMDALHINRDCCRMNMLAKIKLSNL